MDNVTIGVLLDIEKGDKGDLVIELNKMGSMRLFASSGSCSFSHSRGP